MDVHGLTVAGGYGLQQVETQLSPQKDSEGALKFVLAPHLDQFDIVLLDCSPSIGYLTRSALTAADEVLIPIQTEFLALNDLPGILSAVASIKARLNPRLKVTGLVPTMYGQPYAPWAGDPGEDRGTGQPPRCAGLQPDSEDHPFGRSLGPAAGPITKYAPESSATLAYHRLAIEIERTRRAEKTPPPPSQVLLLFPAPCRQSQCRGWLRAGLSKSSAPTAPHAGVPLFLETGYEVVPRIRTD